MPFAYAIIGMIVGLMLAGWGGYYLVAALGGAVIGVLLARTAQLTRRIEELSLMSRISPVEVVPEQKEPAPATPAEKVPDEPFLGQEFSEVSQVEIEETPASPEEVPDPWAREPVELKPSFAQIFLGKATTWFSTGNVPVKIGVIVTFIGVSFLLKYAIDRELLVIPIEFRLLAVAAGGLAMIVIGWRLRSSKEVYALSLQGGGIGVLYLTIFAAFRIWQLLPGPMAFVFLVVLTFCTGALAVLQNSRSLAILGITGGFLAPVLTSTGQGNHVALFSYYLVLNGAILGISWFRAWQSLNLLGFGFTFLIGTLWGYQYYTPALAASTMPFLILHFLFYQAIAILFATRQPPERIGLVDGTLVFGTPAIVFALQSQLMKGTEYGLAISAAVVAVFYALTARFLFRKYGEGLRLLTESFIALAVAFATITIPLALDARWTSAAWALEGAALVWIGMRQQRHLANLAGVALIFLSGAAFIENGWWSRRGIAVLNGNFLGGMLISCSAFFASRKLKPIKNRQFDVLYHFAGIGLFLWGAAWWLGTGGFEITDRARPFEESQVFVLFLALSFTAAAWIGRTKEWLAMRNATYSYLPILMIVGLFTWIFEQHFLFDAGWLAWPLAWLAQVYVLKLLDEQNSAGAASWHFFSLLVFALMLALEAFWWTDDALNEVWGAMVALSVTGVLSLLVWRFRQQPAWPVPVHPVHYLNASIVLVSAQVLFLTLLSISDPGDPSPLPYFPVLNPFDLAMLFAMVVAVLSLSAIRREAGFSGEPSLMGYLGPYKLALAAMFFLLTTAALVRGVHHYSSVPWNGDALMGSVIVQTSLSIYWGLLGFIGMIWGARSLRRPVWLAGAGFMALVVIKLFLVDLGNTGTVERIVSFMGIGALLLVVGYFAPAPPKEPSSDEAGNDEAGEGEKEEKEL